MKIVVALLAVVVALVAVWRVAVPALFESLGRGPINSDNVVVKSVITSSEFEDLERGIVSSGDTHKFVIIDCRINAPLEKVDVWDFQLVKERTSSLGKEENVGSNLDKDYFFWHFLDESGNRSDHTEPSAPAFGVRMAFKVPIEASQGFLFYWGEYFGPLDFT